jgi:DNA invertase Pin-like site-specific DNA recombinase
MSERRPVAYGYSRVSTRAQEKDGTSLADNEVKIKECHAYALKNHEFGGVVEDPATSGMVPVLEREGGKRLDAMLLPGDVVIIPKLDRGFRDLGDCINTVKHWIERGVNIHLIDLKLDTASHIGRLILHVLASVAEFEREMIRERTQAGMEYLESQGFYVRGDKNPYAHKVVRKPGEKHRRLEPWPEDPRRRWACYFIEVKKRLGKKDVYMWCFRNGVKHPTTKREWHAKSVYGLMERERAFQKEGHGPVEIDPSLPLPPTERRKK